MNSPKQAKKQCDDSCIGPECSHFLCHDGESNGTHLVKCEACGKPFCMSHLHEFELSIFLCTDCAVWDATRNPITEDHARGLLARYGVSFSFLVKTTMTPGLATLNLRTAHISKDTGIIYEGAGL